MDDDRPWGGTKSFSRQVNERVIPLAHVADRPPARVEDDRRCSICGQLLCHYNKGIQCYSACRSKR